MKKKLITFLTLSAVTLTSVLGGFSTGCKKANVTPKWYENFYSAMKTAALLQIRCNGTQESKNDFDKLSIQVWSVLNDLENSLSVTVETSSVYKFNQAYAGETVQIDKTTYEVLKIAQNVYTVTEGYYNPAVYYSVQAYGFDGKQDYPETLEQLPKEEDIAKYNELSSCFCDVELKEQNGKYYAVKPNVTVDVGGETLSMKIDLGGIGKGYAVDKVNALIKDHGFKYGYFNFGNSSLSFKTYSEEEGYKLYLANARGQNGKRYATVTVKDVCVSTSGDYEQYFEIDGTRYCHVFDPTTGKPVQTGIMTATIIGGSAAEDDAFTTAIMAMGKEKAVQFINEKIFERQVVISLELGAGKYGIITNIPEGGYVVDDKNFTVLNSVADGKIVLGE